MKKVFLTVVAALVSFVFASAEVNFVDYQWESHGLTFKVPEGMDVIKSEADIFELDNESFFISLEIGDFEGASGDELGESLVKYAKQKGMKIEDAESGSFSGEGFEGAYLEGDRESDNACVALLFSKQSSLLVVVTIIYGKGFETAANDVVNSFKFEK